MGCSRKKKRTKKGQRRKSVLLTARKVTKKQAKKSGSLRDAILSGKAWEDFLKRRRTFD